MKKVLFVSSSVEKGLQKFKNHVQFFKDSLYEVYFIGKSKTEDLQNIDYSIDFEFPDVLNKSDEKKLIKKLRTLFPEKLDVIITFEEISGYLVRMASRSFFNRKSDIFTIHIAEEYNFKAGDESRALVMQKKAAGRTDALVVMNQKDFEIAKSEKLSSNKLVRMHGLGFKSILNEFSVLNKNEMRQKYKIPFMSFSAFYENPFTKQKNQKALIMLLKNILNLNPHFLLLLKGEGPLKDEIKAMVKAGGYEEHVRFLSEDTPSEEILAFTDIVISSALCEGIPEHILQALECQVPVFAPDIKGIRDVVEEGVNAELYTDAPIMPIKLYYLMENFDELLKLRQNPSKKIKYFSTENAEKEMFKYYSESINEHEELHEKEKSVFVFNAEHYKEKYSLAK